LLTTSDSGSVAPGRLADPATPVRLAVLPLDSEPADQDRATAAAEELIAALGEAYAPTLEVIALHSVMHYRGSTSTPSAIARELGVDYVLEGRVRTQEDRARVTLSLVRGRDSTQVWTRTFEQSKHTWTTEAVMAQDVAAALGRLLLPHRARPDAALDIDAQQDMLRGRYLLPRAPRKAAQAFAAVTARVPRSAKAWAALGTAELRTSYRRSAAAAAAADKALALDPAHPEAHFVRAVTAFYGEWNPERARQHLMAAIAANPAFAEAHHTLAAAYSAAGRHDEAIAAMQRAFALDPLAPEVVSDVGWYYYFARRYAEAAVWCRRTLAIDPHFYWAHRCIVMSRMRQGDTTAAVAAALDDLRARGARSEVIDAVTARGLPAYWAWDRDRIEPERDTGDYCDRAATDLALGDTARALDDLEHGVHDRHDWLLPFLAVDPTFDPLRGQPRFDAILRTIAARASL
jgi:serine/threonine-protein kinase